MLFPAEPFKPDANNSAAGSSMERACPVFRGGFVSAVPLPEQNSTHPMNDTSNLSYPGSAAFMFRAVCTRMSGFP